MFRWRNITWSNSKSTAKKSMETTSNKCWHCWALKSTKVSQGSKIQIIQKFISKNIFNPEIHCSAPYFVLKQVWLVIQIKTARNTVNSTKIFPANLLLKPTSISSQFAFLTKLAFQANFLIWSTCLFKQTFHSKQNWFSKPIGLFKPTYL